MVATLSNTAVGDNYHHKFYSYLLSNKIILISKSNFLNLYAKLLVKLSNKFDNKFSFMRNFCPQFL